MPSGKVHDSATLAVTALAALPVAYWQFSDTMTLAEVAAAGAITGSFVLGGLTNLVMSPDADQAEGWGNTGLHRGSRLFGKWWLHYWWSYGKISKHRGLSHAPMIGTLTRVAYVFPVIMIPFLLMLWLYWPIVVAWLVGLMWADLWHTILDLSSKG